LTIKAGVVLGSSDNNWVEIVMAEFSSVVSLDVWVISEDSTVRIPFSDCRAVSGNCFLRVCPDFRSETFGNINLIPIRIKIDD
jgi:hypothetical protein